MANKADKQAKSEPAKDEKVTQINPSAGKTIDERMADLLKDHQNMGARPKG